MKKRYIVLFLGCVLGIFLMLSFNYRQVFQSINKKAVSLEDYSVALIEDELLEQQLIHMKQNLKKSKYILVVKCDESLFLYDSCSVQRATIQKVVRGGSAFWESNQIWIGRNNITTHKSCDSYLKERPCINMNFVNEMTPGKSYLVFLEEEANTKAGETKIYLPHETNMIAPVFCLEEIENKVPVLRGESNYVWYEEVNENEFFVKSEEGMEKMEKFKEEVIVEYIE